MSDREPSDREPIDRTRLRREPPPFRAAEVIGTESRTTRLRRLVLGGPELTSFVVDAPAASVRLLLPSPGAGELVRPSWTGNEFLLPDGRRPVIRTLTPLEADPERGRLTVEVVLHGTGELSNWARQASAGDPVAVSGPGRGYRVDPSAPAFLLAGDESALPAIGELLAVLPPEASVQVHVEVAEESARLDLPPHPRASVQWHVLPQSAAPGEAMVEAVTATSLEPQARVWVAGEAAAVQRVRRLLLDERGVPRSHATVRGYWKHGRAGAGTAS